jgi:hypothetical protein
MFQDLWRRHHWVLTTHRYDSQKQLIADLDEKVIRPAESRSWTFKAMAETAARIRKPSHWSVLS